MVTGPPGKPFSDASPGEAPVQGFLHRAALSSGDALILTHGAGNNCRSRLLVALGGAFAASGLNVLRCDLPFRQEQYQGPPSLTQAKSDQEGLRRAVAVVKQKFSGRVFLGGQSYGGFQASLLAASDPSLVDGLLLLSYPLRPPYAAQIGAEHLRNLRNPALFVVGTNRPFGSHEEWEAAVKLIPAPSKLVSIASADVNLLTNSNRKHLPGEIVVAFRSFFH